MEKYIDIHTHTRRSEIIALVNRFAHEIKVDEHFDGPVSIGFHPWHIREKDISKIIESMDAMSTMREVYAIGECGLDRSVSINFDQQMEVFLKQNEIAIRHELPIILHSVKTYSDFLQLMKEGKMNTPWIFHGYKGNYQTAKRLIDFGAFIAVGSHILNDNSQLNEVVKKIPLQKLFIETDESEIGIENIYKKAAEIRGINLHEFASNMYQNFIYCFNYGIR